LMELILSKKETKSNHLSNLSRKMDKMKASKSNLKL